MHPFFFPPMAELIKQELTLNLKNWWLKEEDFQTYAKNTWHQSKGKAYHNRTNHLANSLKILCKKKKPLQDELKDLEQEILSLQTAPIHKQDFSKEQHLVTRYEQTTTKLNDFYVQRAKKSWAIDGDRNTAFFIEQ
jgi:hypothetical protein